MLRFRLVPSSVGGQISWAVEDFVTLGTSVLDMDDHGTPVREEREEDDTLTIGVINPCFYRVHLANNKT